MSKVLRFPGSTYETPASTARKPTKRTKPSPPLSTEDAAILAAFHRLSEYGQKIAAINIGYWADREDAMVKYGGNPMDAWKRGV